MHIHLVNLQIIGWLELLAALIIRLFVPLALTLIYALGGYWRIVNFELNNLIEIDAPLPSFLTFLHANIFDEIGCMQNTLFKVKIITLNCVNLWLRICLGSSFPAIFWENLFIPKNNILNLIILYLTCHLILDWIHHM